MRLQFRPEFLNRLDEIIIFNTLDKEHIKQIVEIQLKQLKQRLADRNVEISITDEAKNLLADEGFDPVYGARPLKRAIQRLIQDPLALKIIEGEFKEGDTVIVDAGDDRKMVFRKAGEPAMAI